MSIRNLDFLFKPRSIALVGASREPFSVGAVVARNLLNSGFAGPVLPVVPRHKAVEGVLTYPDVAALPVVPDLAVITTPPETVPPLIDSLGRMGTRAVVVITPNFDAGGKGAGDSLRRSLLEAAQPYTMRVVGPNCLGVIVPAIGLNTSVAPLTPRKGPLAFIARSGGVVATALDWASTRGIGFSHFAALGDMSDVDYGDLLDYLAGDVDVRAILMYMEGISDARKFMSAGRAAARLKPVIVIKPRRFRSSQVSEAGPNHIANEDAVFNAAFRRAGMLRVYEIGDLFGAVETLGMGRIAKGDRLAILTNGGGIGDLAADALIEHGGRLARLSAETQDALAAFLPLPGSLDNPVDITGDVPASHYGRALAILLADGAADAVLVMHAPTGIVSPVDAARAVVAAPAKSSACVLTCWLGEGGPREARKLFTEHRLPTYETPERAIRAFMHIITYRRNQQILTETPISVPETFDVDLEEVRDTVTKAMQSGKSMLGEREVSRILNAYQIGTTRYFIATDPESVASMAASLSPPLTLKLAASNPNGPINEQHLAVDLRSSDQVRAAAESMLSKFNGNGSPRDNVEFLVQENAEHTGACELFLGVRSDPQFGPVILFGSGGPAWDIIDDITIALPPLNMHLARDAILNTRISPQLRGLLGRRNVDIDDLALTLIKVSQLVVDCPEISALTINPLLADQRGIIAAAATIEINRDPGQGVKRLAIRPYPKELEETLALPDGRVFLLRPVLPEDEPAFQELFQRLSPEDVRMRFFAPKKALVHPVAARMTQIDYDREMALVLAEPGTPGRSRIFGAVHITADPDNETAEYAIMLQSDMSGIGLGPLLMRRIIDYSRKRGIKEIFGEVLRENRPMLKVCELFQFSRSRKPEDPGTIEVRLKL
ncbi:MAG: bifunctional acetate--CoA ligase family protein/GNAT family N-acetyltransferase [Rhodospirillales bacterium]